MISFVVSLIPTRLRISRRYTNHGSMERFTTYSFWASVRIFLSLKKENKYRPQDNPTSGTHFILLPLSIYFLGIAPFVLKYKTYTSGKPSKLTLLTKSAKWSNLIASGALPVPFGLRRENRQSGENPERYRRCMRRDRAHDESQSLGNWEGRA